MIQAIGSSLVKSLRKWALAADGSKRSRADHVSTCLVAGLLVAAVAWGGGAQARPGPADELPAVSLQTLPPEARETHRLILSGGPFPYEKDGTVFGNRERLLPGQVRGFYREYTVRTPGARNRGERRIVCGGQPPTQPEVCYYTADHYASFSRIAQ